MMLHDTQISGFPLLRPTEAAVGEGGTQKRSAAGATGYNFLLHSVVLIHNQHSTITIADGPGCIPWREGELKLYI